MPDAKYWHGAWYRDAEPHPTQRYTIAGIIAHSLNDGMIQVADHVTPAEQYQMFRAFGIGSYSGLNLPGESAGLLAPPSQWIGGQANTRYQISFGQSVGVTALQMASVYATIANGGVRVAPSIVAGHTTAAGRYVAAPRPAARRVISARTAAELMRTLEQVPVVYSQAGESVGNHPRLHRGGQDRHRPGGGKLLRVELHRHRPGQEQRAGRRGQPAGPAQRDVLRDRRRRARSSTRS